MFWHRNKRGEKKESKIILGMILLASGNSFDIETFTQDFKSHYGNKPQDLSGDNTSYVFKLVGSMIAIGHIPTQIPIGDIEGTAQYAYNWKTALEDSKEHKSHLLVSLVQSEKNQIIQFASFTQVVCSLLRTTNAIGIYLGNQSLLIPKNDYLTEAEPMSEEYLPLNLWIYFGLRATNKGNSGYTYGLKEFGKNEMEILNSTQSLENIRNLLFNISHYVLTQDVILKEGETVGRSQEEKVSITFSKGQFIDGSTYKLLF